MEIKSYWDAVLRQDADAIRPYFAEDAYVNWHCTNEHFTVEEFIRANCEYPGSWNGEIERMEQTGDLTICVARVYSEEEPLSFHVVSFIRIAKDKIISVDEYWGEDGSAPQWRLDKKIGSSIQERPLRQ